MRKLSVLMFALATLAVTAVAYPHGGGLDRYGCHRDCRTGMRHCHEQEEEPVEEWSMPEPDPRDVDNAINIARVLVHSAARREE